VPGGNYVELTVHNFVNCFQAGDYEAQARE